MARAGPKLPGWMGVIEEREERRARRARREIWRGGVSGTGSIDMDERAWVRESGGGPVGRPPATVVWMKQHLRAKNSSAHAFVEKDA